MLKDHSTASRWDKWCLRKTELTDKGGKLETISERAKKNYALTEDMAAQLTHAGGWCIAKVAEFEGGNRA